MRVFGSAKARLAGILRKRKKPNCTYSTCVVRPILRQTGLSGQTPLCHSTIRTPFANSWLTERLIKRNFYGSCILNFYFCTRKTLLRRIKYFQLHWSDLLPACKSFISMCDITAPAVLYICPKRLAIPSEI
jgi:hypothetical protein